MKLIYYVIFIFILKALNIVIYIDDMFIEGCINI